MSAVATADARELRHSMIDQLKQRGLEVEPAIEMAFRTIPREVFLPDVPLERVYSGDAVITKQDEAGRPISSSSEVGIMIVMAHLLDVAPGQRILEIGAGTGYNAAVLAALVGERGAITTIDIDADIAALARQHLARAGVDRVAVITADGWEGRTDNAPYDRIEVTASVSELIRRVAQAHGGYWIDLRTAFRGPNDSYDETHLLASDGDHPNAAGHVRIEQAIARTLALHA